MAANRGVYMRRDSSPAEWQEACTFIGSLPDFDNLIYIHGSTCSKEVALTMTLAHELQHFVQYGTAPRLFAENTLAYVTLANLGRSDFDALGLRACDVPHEREARIVAKRVAESLLGAEVVRQHVDAKMAEFVSEQDAADWDCIQRLDSSAHYDLAAETMVFFRRLTSCRSAIEQELSLFRANDPGFWDIDLDALLGASA